MCLCKYALILVTASVVGRVRATPKKYAPDDDSGRSVLDKVVKDCLESSARISCFSEKVAVALERSMNWNIPISDGINFLRNQEKINHRSPKHLTGFKRLASAISNFLDTHMVSIDLTQSQGRSIDDSTDAVDRSGGGGGGGAGAGGLGGGGGLGSGLFSFNRKDLRRERRYYRYAFMVLLGIFGLTGPIVMKVLGVMAAHALLASKAALIIVGGVALKKIFEQGHDKPKVKVHTVPLQESEEHDYDRIGHSYNYNYIPFGSYSHLTTSNRPYSGYSNSDDEFAPIFYGTPKKSDRTIS